MTAFAEFSLRLNQPRRIFGTMRRMAGRAVHPFGQLVVLAVLRLSPYFSVTSTAFIKPFSEHLSRLVRLVHIMAEGT